MPGFAQPLNVRGSVEQTERLLLNREEDALCLHWQHRPGDDECVYDFTLRYTSLKELYPSADGAESAGAPMLQQAGAPMLQQIFTCDTMQSFSVTNDTFSPDCSNGFQGSSQVLYLEGPTFLFSRTPHFPHFLEEVMDAMTYLLEHNVTRFEHAVIDTAGGACVSFDSYVTGQWAPSGSPLGETLQILMLQTVASGIVFSWGLRPGKSVCFGSPWRRPTDWHASNLRRQQLSEQFRGMIRDGTQLSPGWNAQSHLQGSGTLRHQRVCLRFRSRMSELLRPSLTPAAAGSGPLHHPART